MSRRGTLKRLASLHGDIARLGDQSRLDASVEARLDHMTAALGNLAEAVYLLGHELLADDSTPEAEQGTMPLGDASSH